MKNKIIITNNKRGYLDFYFQTEGRTLYLFTETFSKSVYDFFYNGRFESEVLGFKGWRGNHRLSKTISKIPMYIRYALREEAAAYEEHDYNMSA